MVEIKLKRVYEEMDKSDGIRIFVDRLWPRGLKKEVFHYDVWEKDITPSPSLRQWFHQAPEERWNEFISLYQKELEGSEAVAKFVASISQYPVVTLLYASKNPDHNHARILKDFLDNKIKIGYAEGID